eukprot:gene22939-29714_t
MVIEISKWLSYRKRTYLWNSAALLIYVVSWFVQIYIGHGFYEKNTPGFLTKCTVHSILLSPMLAWDTTLRRDA